MQTGREVHNEQEEIRQVELEYVAWNLTEDLLEVWVQPLQVQPLQVQPLQVQLPHLPRL